MNGSYFQDAQTWEIIATASEVYVNTGPDYVNAVYQKALTPEFSWRGIPFRKDVPLLISCKSAVLSTSLRAELSVLTRNTFLYMEPDRGTHGK